MQFIQRPNKSLLTSLLLLGLSFALPFRWLRWAAKLSWLVWGQREVASGTNLARKGLGMAALRLARRL
jgi:hypothetical protein